MALISRMTRFGRYVFAMGGNPEAAELAGINVKKVTVMVFGLMGALCAIAAVITTARLNAGTNSMGLLSELNVIAAAVIGGTSLAGGVGTIMGDAGVNIAPTLEQKAEITQNAIDVARSLGITQPRVAILASTENVNPRIPANVEAAALAKMADRRQITGALVDGPLALDEAGIGIPFPQMDVHVDPAVADKS